MGRLTNDRRMLEYGCMSPYSNILCFSTTRHGGFGEGLYASFNCTPYTGDCPDHVARNQALLRGLLPAPCELVIPYQTHDCRILQVDEAYAKLTEAEREASLQGIDALMTDCPGYCLCVSTADCVPVLLYDKAHQAVAAVHAGWRGTVARIVGKTLRRMASVYGTCGREVIACIGPSISLEAFETGDEVCRLFQESGFPMERVARRNRQTGKWHLDLWEANRLQLSAFGIPDEQIELAGICTYARHDDFFSARRLGIKSGRMLSGIMLKRSVAEQEK